MDEDGAAPLSAPSPERPVALTELYGSWQTIPYVAPPAVGGVVPRSAHGHVELWTAAHLPFGTVHLRAPHVAAAAKQLGVDAAPAMVGFDVHDGRPVPKFDGVVVCAEHAELLREAAASMAERAEDADAHRRRQEALGLWRTLIHAMAVRRRLEQQYGDK